MDSLIQNIPSLITAQQNNKLLQDISLEELRQVVFEMDKNSAPGPDGFSCVFFMHFWDIIAVDMLQVVREFMAGVPMLKGISISLIILTPKKPNPMTFVDIRPISLCTFVNKVFTKILVNQMCPMLPLLISPESFCKRKRYLKKCIACSGDGPIN